MSTNEPSRTLTSWEKFVSLARKVVQTPKAEVDKRDLQWRRHRAREKKRAG